MRQGRNIENRSLAAMHQVIQVPTQSNNRLVCDMYSCCVLRVAQQQGMYDQTAATSTGHCFCHCAGGVGQELAARGGRQRQRSLAAGKAGSSSTSRAPDAAGQGSRTAANTSDDGSSCAAGGSGVSSCSSSNSSSRRGSGDKPHVPIWERSLPSGPAEARRTAAAAAGPKVLQTVALKTFSPTLGSFGPMLGDPHGKPTGSLDTGSCSAHAWRK